MPKTSYRGESIGISSARELVQVARLLFADDYPMYASDKVQEAFDVIKHGIEEKHVWNVDYKEANRRISVGYEEAWKMLYAQLPSSKSYSALRYLPYVVYYVEGSLGVLTSIKKSIKACSAFVKNPDKIVERVNGRKDIEVPLAKDEFDVVMRHCKKTIKFLESWKPVLDMRKAVKPFIEKGRKPSGKPAKPVYKAPRVPTKSVSYVKQLLTKAVKEQRNDVIKSYASMYLRWAEMFLERRDETQTVDDFYRNGRAPDVRCLVEVVGEKESLPWVQAPKEYRLKSDARSVAKNKAIWLADYLGEKFLTKNIDKIGSIVHRKGGLTGGKSSGHFEGFGFSGEILLEFADSTSFIVRNKAIMKYSLRGKQFEQYPTTFHNVVFPDGSMKKMVPQKDMNERWATQ